MLGNRSKDTKLEVAVRSALHSAGLRYFKHRRPLPDQMFHADVVFPRLKLAVFIDGCFWHGCPRHSRRPSPTARNRDWWLAKLDRNIARDRRHEAMLHDAGWRVIRIWEHESPTDAAERVFDAVSELRLHRRSR